MNGIVADKPRAYDTDLFDLWLKGFGFGPQPPCDGNYGCLLDGASNIFLTGKIAHFEIRLHPEAAKLLRAVAGFFDHQLHAPAHHHDAARAS